MCHWILDLSCSGARHATSGETGGNTRNWRVKSAFTENESATGGMWAEINNLHDTCVFLIDRNMSQF